MSLIGLKQQWLWIVHKFQDEKPAVFIRKDFSQVVETADRRIVDALDGFAYKLAVISVYPVRQNFGKYYVFPAKRVGIKLRRIIEKIP